MSKCGQPCQVFTRVCGYFRPTFNFNKGKKAEVADRKMFNVEKAITDTKTAKAAVSGSGASDNTAGPAQN